jgi:hypothetical protein
MEVRLKNILVSAMALLCVTAPRVYTMDALQKNILITILYHHPTRGSTAHYFSVPYTCNVGQLQQFVSQKLGTILEDQKLFVSKSHIERHPSDEQKNYLIEVTKVLLDPQRPLDNDSEFGIPIAKEVHYGMYTFTHIVGYVPPCFDLVCLSDFAHPHTLPEKFSVLFRENTIIKKSSTYDMIKHGLEMSDKTRMNNNNDFKDF